MNVDSVHAESELVSIKGLNEEGVSLHRRQHHHAASKDITK
ncbi:unnamed protein product [Anisakis simplex]|uniref:Uncharacterized protein n=1 Tax=Anisakis simplex TaxID=6269 RepID=A0A3P6P7G4_ANISI|nr:unnamed protein product [Anisakis simplex]